MKESSSRTRVEVTIFCLLYVVTFKSTALGHDGCSRPSRSSIATAESESSDRVTSRSKYIPLTAVAPHQGQLLTTKWQSFEVVYLPKETRVYFYDYMEKPFTARGASGEIIMQVTGNPELFRNPLRYVPQPPGSHEQDYLAAQVDVAQIRDGDMRVYFDLVNLPYAQEPKLRFDQSFKLVGRRPLTSESAKLVQAECGDVPDSRSDNRLGVGQSPTAYPAVAASLQQPLEEDRRFVLPQTGFNRASKCEKGCCK